MIRIAVFASGKGSNFKTIAKTFQRSRQIKVACLVCDQPDAGALLIAEKLNIKIHLVPCTVYKTKLEPAMEKELTHFLKAESIDLIVLAGYMRIVKEPLLTNFKDRIINIHPSLLPSFKGLHAVRQALEQGVKITGCTVHTVDKEVDHGKILAQRHVYISSHDNEKSLHEKIHREEHKIYPVVIKQLAKQIKKEKKS